MNGRIFVNNVSLGIYGDAVQQPGYRNAKLRTLLETIPHEARPASTESELRWTDPEGRQRHGRATVLVSNNPYRLDETELPGPPTTRRGTARRRGGRALESAPASLGRPPRWREWTAPSFTVEAGSALAAGIDGEAARLEPPLRFETRPGALKVRVARSHPGASRPATETET